MPVEFRRPWFLIGTLIKTLRFNFYYFPFKQAIRLPVLISQNVWLKRLRGSVELQGPIKTGLVKIGFGDIAIFDNIQSRAIWSVEGKVIFAGRANIGHSVRFSVQPNGVLRCGEHLIINAETAIVCRKQVTFGDNNLISWQCMICDSDLHDIFFQGNLINADRPVVLGDRVWLGMRVNVLKGTEIASGSVIGAGSRVSGTLKHEKSIYAGTPARLVKQNVEWVQ